VVTIEAAGPLLTADLVMLIKNSAYPHLIAGLKQEGYSTSNIITFSDTNEAHNQLPNYIQNNDVVLFQNDWSDNYY
jgi:hypothetical protein